MPKKSKGKPDVQLSLDDVVKQINTQHGEGTLMPLHGKSDLESVSTGFHGIDETLGGGIVLGAMIEVFGPESSGKTTFSIAVMAAFQRAGHRVVFIDAEHSFNTGWAKKIGVNTEEVMICQPNSGEEALQVADALVKSQAVGLIVIDSVSALVPKTELEGEMGQSHVGLQARLMSQACRKLYSACEKTKTTVLFINQIREKVGVMFGSPETTSGGRGLKFGAFQRIDIRRISAIKVGDEVVGQRTRIKAVKNKLGAPFRQCEADLRYDAGFCRASDLIDCAVSAGVITKKGAWFAYKGEQLGQGKEFLRQKLLDDNELLEGILSDVKSESVTGVQEQ